MCVYIFALILLHKVTLGAIAGNGRLAAKNGGFTGLVIAVDDDVPESNILIERIKVI